MNAAHTTYLPDACKHFLRRGPGSGLQGLRVVGRRDPRRGKPCCVEGHLRLLTWHHSQLRAGGRGRILVIEGQVELGRGSVPVCGGGYRKFTCLGGETPHPAEGPCYK